jgi:hypothetical protein
MTNNDQDPRKVFVDPRDLFVIMRQQTRLSMDHFTAHADLATEADPLIQIHLPHNMIPYTSR